MSKWHNWTPEEDDIIRRDYRHTIASKKEIAYKLGVSWPAVNGRIQLMGIAKRTDRMKWSEDQDDKLIELMGIYSPYTVARKMHRSVNSVCVRFSRLHGSRLARNGWFTKRELCELLGMEHRWVQARIDSGAIKATYHYGSRPGQKGMSAWHIEEKDLRAYLIKHSIELNGRNVDLPLIIDIILNGKGGKIEQPVF